MGGHPLESWSTVRDKLSQWQFIPNPWYENVPPTRGQQLALPQQAFADEHDYQYPRRNMELPPIPQPSQDHIYESIKSIKRSNTQTCRNKNTIIKAAAIAITTLSMIGVITWLCMWMLATPPETPIKRNKRNVPETRADGISIVRIKLAEGMLTTALNKQKPNKFKLTMARDEFEVIIDHSRRIKINKRGPDIRIDLTETLSTLQRTLQRTNLQGKVREKIYVGTEETIDIHYDEQDIIIFRLDFFKPRQRIMRSIKTTITPSAWETHLTCGEITQYMEEKTSQTQTQIININKQEQHIIKKTLDGEYLVTFTTPSIINMVVFAEQTSVIKKPATTVTIPPLNGYLVMIVTYLSNHQDIADCGKFFTKQVITDRKSKSFNRVYFPLKGIEK